MATGIVLSAGGLVVPWLVLAAVCLVTEVLTGRGWLTWPAGSAVMTAALSKVWVFHPLAQVAIFLGLTCVSTLVGERTAFPPMRRRRPPQEAHIRLVGLSGIATRSFRGGVGRVEVAGKRWPAELENQSQLQKGARIYVVAVKNGPCLIVRSSELAKAD